MGQLIPNYSAAMRKLIIEAAMRIEQEEGYGYKPWEWPDSEFQAIEALIAEEGSEQRSAAQWEALIDAAYAAEDGSLAARLEIAQRLLEL